MKMQPRAPRAIADKGNGEGGGSSPAVIWKGICESADLLFHSRVIRASVMTICAVAIAQALALLLTDLF
jgi:hypothetical protein